MVSNAYRHGRPPRAVHVTLIHGGRRVRIEVDDAGLTEPKPRIPDRTGGLGLVLVDRLATGWGVRRHPHHKTVWAEVDLTGVRGAHAHLTIVPTAPPQPE